MQPVIRNVVLSGGRGLGFFVAGYGIIRTLTELGIIINANPTLDVTMLDNYDAQSDGIFAASPLGSTGLTTYTGTFDGQGFHIRNFRLVDTSDVPGNEDGLFGNVGNNSGIGTVKNLIVSGSIIQTAWERTTRGADGRYLLGSTVGGVVGSLRGSIEQVTSNMVVYGSGAGGQYGGLVGRNEQWPDKVISNITQANPGVVTITNHGMKTGTRVYIKNVTGMTEVNNKLYTITSTGTNTFSINADTSGYSSYISGGIASGAGTVKNCISNASVSLNIYNYNTYQSSLVASNRGFIDSCVTTSASTCTAPGGNQPNPVVANYNSGWTGAASISGTTMTVTDTSLGSMRVGLYLYAPNSVPGAIIASGNQVVADLGGGDWQVSIAQNVSSRDLMAATGAPGTFLTTGSWMGGIAGDNGLPVVGDSPTSIINSSQSYVNLVNSNNINSANLTGGIIGYQGDGTVENCHSYGTITGANSVGGVVGLNALSSSVIRRCGSQGSIIGLAGNVGGIAGQDYGTTTESWSSGSVSGLSATGGAIGLMRGTATASSIFAFGNVTGTIGVGGLIGQSIAGASLSTSYSLGVPVGNSRVGGLIGTRASGTNISDSYWDIDTSGTPIGNGSDVSTGITGLSDSALLAGMPSGFSIPPWIRGIITPNYPVLSTAPTPPNPTVNPNPPPSISLFATSTSVDSTSITLPTGILPGDYCYLINFAQNSTVTVPATVLPTGFTLVNQQFSNATHGSRISAQVKILDGTETTVSGMTTGTRGRMMIAMVFRGTHGTSSSTWTRLNARVVINGASGGNAVQSMAAGTAPCMIVGCAIYDNGTPPANQISLGDNAVIDATSAITPSLLARASFHINNIGAAASTFTGDIDAGGTAVICVNISFAV